MIIETDFADSHDLGMLSELAQIREGLRIRFLSIVAGERRRSHKIKG